MQILDDHTYTSISVGINFVKPCSLHCDFFLTLGTYCALKDREYCITLIIIYSMLLQCCWIMMKK